MLPKAIDVWIGVCLAFIFGALLEFALVNYAARKDMMLESRGRAMRSAGRPTGRATRATLHPPSSTALDDFEMEGGEQQLASCNNAFVMVIHCAPCFLPHSLSAFRSRPFVRCRVRSPHLFCARSVRNRCALRFNCVANLIALKPLPAVHTAPFNH